MAKTLDETIAANRTYSHLLGWKLSDFGATTFNATLIDAIRAQQALLNLPVDGIAGPRTYTAYLAAVQAHLEAHPSGDLLRDAGVIALCEAKIVWMTNVVDLPPKGTPDYEHDRLIIDAMIRTPAGINWSWWPPYERNFKWCGAACSCWWRQAGLKLAIAYKWFASTLRLDAFSRYGQFDETPNPKPSTGPYRMRIVLDEHSKPWDVHFPDGTYPREGDILMVGVANSAYGTHITTVESFDEGTGAFTTIEGNGTGLSPTGQRQHGIVRAVRPTGIPVGMGDGTYHARRVIRLAPTDLENG